VRQFERHYFAQIFSPQPDFASDWLLVVGESLRTPKFLVSQRAALARRLRRNYIRMLLILLMAWLLKLSTPGLLTEGVRIGFVGRCARPSPAPPWAYSWRGHRRAGRRTLCLPAGHRVPGSRDDGELSFGDVHV
jgi:uncharacterized membrane protein